MTLRHIEIFAMVCREGSVTRAAERLHISQPTVSVAIREMEEHYGDALFERISHKLYLTPFGHIIYDYSLNLLNVYSDMSDAHQKYDMIRVGTGTAVGKLFLPSVVKGFTTMHPDVRVRVSVGDATRMNQLVMQNNADFVIAETVDDIYGLAHRSIQHYPIVAICHKDNPLAKKEVVTAEDLAAQNLLLREPKSRTRRLVDSFFQRHNIEASPMWESYSVQTLLNATMENIGVSFHSLDHAVACRNVSLVILNVPDFQGERYVNISYHKDKIITPTCRRFWITIRKRRNTCFLKGLMPTTGCTRKQHTMWRCYFSGIRFRRGLKEISVWFRCGRRRISGKRGLFFRRFAL